MVFQNLRISNVTSMGGALYRIVQSTGTGRQKIFPLLTGGMVIGGMLYTQPNWADTKSSKQAFIWGSNMFGQLGLGDEIGRSSPTPLELQNVVQIAPGENNVVALDTDGQVYTWGRGLNQVLGHGESNNVSVPSLVEIGDGQKAVFVACSGQVSSAVLADGTVWTWGTRSLGHDGDGASPQQVEGLSNVQTVACGRSHILAVTNDGKLYAWGSGYDGALGLGGKNDCKYPEEVKALAGKRVVKVEAGIGYSVILTEEGEVYTCGIGDYGQTGHGSVANRYIRVPTLIRALKGKKVTDIAAGPYHAACSTDKGQMYVWGMGADGQIGNGGNNFHNPLPQKPQSSELPTTIVQVSCGGSHTGAVTNKGQLYVWGKGRDGQLGKTQGAVAGRTSAPSLVSLPAVKNVALGTAFSIALL